MIIERSPIIYGSMVHKASGLKFNGNTYNRYIDTNKLYNNKYIFISKLINSKSRG